MTELLIYAFVLFQSVISIKPGFVDLVDGKNERPQIRARTSGQDGSDGSAESCRDRSWFGLDSLLRLDENSAVVLESLDKTDVVVRVASGPCPRRVPTRKLT
jgi:hypothetical protein